MSIIAIADWLNADGPYPTGVALLKQYGNPSPTDLFIFSLPETSVLRSQLRAALKAIVEPAITHQGKAMANVRSKKLTSPAPAVAPTDLEDSTRPDITVDMLPPELRPLRIDLKRKHAAYIFLRGSMLNTPDGWELNRSAAQAIRLRMELKEGWNKLEAWRRTGLILDDAHVKGTAKMDAAQIIARRNNIRTYISRHNSGKRPLSPEKLAAFKAELATLESSLDAPSVSK